MRTITGAGSVTDGTDVVVQSSRLRPWHGYGKGGPDGPHHDAPTMRPPPPLRTGVVVDLQERLQTRRDKQAANVTAAAQAPTAGWHLPGRAPSSRPAPGSGCA